MEGRGKGVYTQFAPSNASQNDTRATLATLRRYSRDQQYSKRLARDIDIKAQEAQLFSLKETIPDVNLTTKRPFMGLCCENCTFISRQSWVRKITENLVIANVLQNQVVTKYDYSNKPPVIKKSFQSQERIENAIKKISQTQLELIASEDDDLYHNLLTRNRKRAETLWNDIRGKVSYSLLRLVSWALSKILPRFVSSLCVHKGQVGILREAARSNLPIVFLTSGDSHSDLLIVAYLVFKFNLKCPIISVDHRYNVPLLGSLLRGVGAFFTKPLQNNPIYEALLSDYVKTSLHAGCNLLFPITKRDILSVVVDSLTDGTLDDVLLVPVALNCDKLIGGHFPMDPKNQQSIFSSTKTTWRTLMGGYGMIRVDFNQPFSLKEFVKTFHTKHNDVLMSDVDFDKRQGMEQYLYEHVAYNCTQSVAVMATNAVAFLLRTKYRDGATLGELSSALDDLRKELEFIRKDAGFLGRSEDVVLYGVDMLGPGLVSTDLNRIKPRPDGAVELARYSERVVAYFAWDSVIAIALRMSNVHGNLVYHDDLMRHVLQLCDTLSHEFVFCKPCEDLERIAVSAIDDLAIKTGVFVTDNNAELIQRNRKMVEHLDDDEVVLKTYKVVTDEGVEERLACLRSVLGPVLEAYAATASGLRRLLDQQLFENELVEEIVADIRLKSDRKYAESARKEWVENALRVFERWGVVEGHTEGKLRILYLKDGREAVDEVCSQINEYREAVGP